MRSTRSNTSAPSWSRTVSPRMRPSRRISVRSRASSCASSTRLARTSVSEGTVWGRHGWLLQRLPGKFRSVQVFAAVQDKDGGGALCPGLIVVRR